MKQKGIQVSFFVILSVVLLYFFTCSVLGEFFIYHGRMRKIIYLILIFGIAFTITILLGRQTSLFENISQISMRDVWNHNKKRFHIEKADMILLLCIVLAGAVFRLAGINWGVTCIFQADERKLVKPAIEMAINVWPYDGNMGYPNQLISKLAAVCIAVYSRITGAELIVDSIYGYFIFRIITAVFSTCTIITVFLIGNCLKKHMGVIVAVLVAIFPEYVGLSKQVTADTTALFFMSLVLIMSLIYQEKESRFSLVMMAVFAAMATMEKWHSAVACFYIAIVVLLNCKKIQTFIEHGIIAFFTYVVTMCIIAPNGFWHLKGTIRGLTGMYEYDKDGFHTYSELLRVYFDRLFQYVGIVFMILVIVGIVYAVRSREQKYLVLVLGVLKLAAICFLNRGYPRWGLEFYFTMLLLASIGAYALITDHRRAIRYSGCVIFALVIVCLGCGCALTVTTAVRSEQDTRILQDDYCRQHNITEVNSAYDDYTAFQPGGLINCKREVMKTHNTIEEYLTIKDGKLYRKSAKILYIIDNMDRDNSEINELLERDGSIEKEFATIGTDIHRGAVVGIEKDPWEWGIIENNLKQIVRILKGENIGPSITIYDVTDIPVKIVQ